MFKKKIAKKFIVSGLTSKVYQYAIGCMPNYRVRRWSVEGEGSCSAKGLTFLMRP